jgi:hypothetical protein
VDFHLGGKAEVAHTRPINLRTAVEVLFNLSCEHALFSDLRKRIDSARKSYKGLSVKPRGENDKYKNNEPKLLYHDELKGGGGIKATGIKALRLKTDF